MRGLNAPPRRSVAPAAFTAFAMAITCSSLSTLHGPAITWKFPAPTFGPPQSTTESSGWNLRFASLYGSWMRWTVSTTLSAWTRPMSRRATSPTHPMIVSDSPALTCGVTLWSRSQPSRQSTCFLSAFFFNVMIMFFSFEPCQQKRPRSSWSGAVIR